MRKTARALAPSGSLRCALTAPGSRPAAGGPVGQLLGMLSSSGGSGSRSRKLAAAAAVQAALTRSAAEGTGGRREGAGAQEVGPPSPSGPQGERGAAAAAAPRLGSVSRAEPATVAAAAEQQESGAALR